MTGMLIAVAITFFIGVVLVVVILTGRSATTARLMEVAAPTRTTAEVPRTMALSHTLTTVSSAAGWVRKTVGISADSDVARRLALAGYRKPEHVDIYYGVKLLGPVLGAAIAGFVIKSDVFFWFIALTAVGFFGPDFWLTSAISKHREAVRLALPDALDLLVICMEAGLGLDQALIRVGEELKVSHRELSEEFLLINLEQRAGRPRLEAWRHMADRMGLEVIRSFVSMLVQTERFGTPISRSLANFADALRTRRRQQAEEMAAKTTVKMIFPLVLFIFPSMFIVLLAPAIIAMSKSLGEAFK